MDTKPKGLHAVVSSSEELPEGVIFVLKNVNNSVNIDNQNRIHPFYMVYIGMDGDIICDYLNPKQLLDDIRLLCRGKKEPIVDLCHISMMKLMMEKICMKYQTYFVKQFIPLLILKRQMILIVYFQLVGPQLLSP